MIELHNHINRSMMPGTEAGRGETAAMTSKMQHSWSYMEKSIKLFVDVHKTRPQKPTLVYSLIQTRDDET